MNEQLQWAVLAFTTVTTLATAGILFKLIDITGEHIADDHEHDHHTTEQKQDR